MKKIQRKKYYFVVYGGISPGSDSIEPWYITETLEEAILKVRKCCICDRSLGTGYIAQVDGNLKEYRSWTYKKNKLIHTWSCYKKQAE